jgi:methionyl-tRNA formyltransferase
MGKGELAIRIGEHFLESSKYDLRMVIPVIPEPNWTDSFSSWATAKGIRVLESGDVNHLPSDQFYDLGFSCYYDKILTLKNLESFELALNLHNAPLPKYRGVNPINWALKNSEKSHGVTIHMITPGIDDGPIYGQSNFPIDPECDEVIDVYRKCLHYGEELFIKLISTLDSIEPRHQVSSHATYYSKKDSAFLGDRSDFKRNYDGKA